MVNRLSQPIPMGDPPRSVGEAVEKLISELPLRYAAKIAKMNGRDLSALHATIGPYVRDNFGLWRGNDQLMESCRMLNDHDYLHIDSASMTIIGALWEKLKNTHGLRVVNDQICKQDSCPSLLLLFFIPTLCQGEVFFLTYFLIGVFLTWS